ncbi:MAG: DUF4140 domain-containing protein, partial [bacterium]|nr:DUF4140 domain-containing protein [bacterium]
MKNVLSIICLVVVVSSSMLFPAKPVKVDIPSSIRAVTVFSDRAMVTREMKTDVTEGRYILKFSNLPMTINERSVQVTGKGTAAATLLDVQLKREFLTREHGGHGANVAKAPLEERKKQIDTELDILNDRLAVLG